MKGGGGGADHGRKILKKTKHAPFSCRLNWLHSPLPRPDHQLHILCRSFRVDSGFNSTRFCAVAHRGVSTLLRTLGFSSM